MLHEDKNALICDLAETYGIYDYKRLPLQTVAVFAIGLREDSRIKLLMNSQKMPLQTQLLVAIYDQLNLLLWTKTEDGEKGINRPKRLSEMLEGTKESVGFNSGEDFEKRRNELLRQITERGSDGN